LIPCGASLKPILPFLYALKEPLATCLEMLTLNQLTFCGLVLGTVPLNNDNIICGMPYL